VRTTQRCLLHFNKQNMNILLDARAADVMPFGVGRYAREMVRLLPRLQPDWTWYVLRHGEHRATRRKNVHTLYRATPLFHYPAEQMMYQEVLRDLCPDLVHALWFPVPENAAAPTILTIQDAILEQGWPEFQDAWNLKMRFWHQRNARHADHVIVPSHSTQRDVQRVYHQSKKAVTVIPLGVGKSFRKTTRKTVDAVRAEYGLPHRYIFCAAHDTKSYKNIAVVIEAAKQMGQRGIEVPAMVRTGGAMPPGPHWRNTGHVDDHDLAALISGALFSVVPSRSEGFGLPVLEAMACGTPVISSNTTSLPEVGGNAALYFDPQSPDELAAAMISLMNDASLHKELRRKGLERVKAFTWEQCAESTLELYTRLAGKKRKRRAPVALDWPLIAIGESIPPAPFTKRNAADYIGYAYTLFNAGLYRKAAAVFEKLLACGYREHNAAGALEQCRRRMKDAR
jgi:alpha-1,3-rhamnosyl/mannosyltransferase